MAGTHLEEPGRSGKEYEHWGVRVAGGAGGTLL